MLSKGHITVVSVIVFAMLASAAIAYGAAVGETAPGFTLDSLMDDKQIQLSDYFDKPTILVFWASWCPHCQRELPELQKLFLNMNGKINVIGVSLDDNKAKAKSLVKKNAISFPNATVTRTQSDKLIEAYEISGIPAVFVLDKGGKVGSVFSGQVDNEALRKAIEE